MTVSLSGFKARYDEFDSKGDPWIQVRLDDATSDINLNVFPDHIQDRVVYALAAHYMALKIKQTNGQGNAGASLPVASKSVDKVSVGYAQSASTNATDDGYNSTIYGQEFMRLVRTYSIKAVSING